MAWEAGRRGKGKEGRGVEGGRVRGAGFREPRPVSSTPRVKRRRHAVRGRSACLRRRSPKFSPEILETSLAISARSFQSAVLASAPQSAVPRRSNRSELHIAA